MAEQVILAYNGLASFITRYPVLLHLGSPAVQSDASKLDAWLADRSWPLGPYLASCYAKHNWAYQPKLHRLTMRAYALHFERNREDAYGWWSAIELYRAAHQPIKGLKRGREIVKKRLLAHGGPVRCCGQYELTGGFDPTSPVCRCCRKGD